MIRICDGIILNDNEIVETFTRAAGPGGQNVNKLATAVQLRFDVRRSPNLPPDVAMRLERLAGKRLTGDGVLIILARRHRTQERNRADAIERLVTLIRRAAAIPPPRRPTRPSVASKERRLASKQAHARVKSLRRPIAGEE